MSENGPLMYKVKPLYDSRPDITLPTCMYKMNNLYGNATSVESGVSNVDQDELRLIELEKRQLEILQKLKVLKDEVIELTKDMEIKSENINVLSIDKFQDIVIKANPQYPPISIWIFYKLISQTTATRLATHVHSSLKSIPENISKLPTFNSTSDCLISLRIIWRDGSKDHEMMVNPIHQGPIEGEVNIARYISRLLSFNYDADPISSTQIDDWLEVAHSCVIHGNNKDRQAAVRSLNGHLGKNTFLVGDALTIADIVMWSVLIQAKLHSSLPTNVMKWFKSLLNSDLFEQCSSFI